MNKILKTTALLTAFITCFSLCLCGCESAESRNSKENSSAETVTETTIENKKEQEKKEQEEQEKKEKEEQEKKEQEEQEKKEKKEQFEFSIKSTSLSSDYDGSDVLVIEYDFTNNSKNATSFTMSCQDTVFQDGVECDSNVIGCDEIDVQEQLNDIQSGNTYTLKVGYHIKDLSKPVNVVITDLFGTKTFLEETIELNN